MNRIRRLGIWLLSLVTVLACGALPAQAAGGITADGKPVVSSVSAEIVDGVLMIPLRAVAEAMGAQVSWDAAGKTATVRTAAATIELTVGKTAARVNGHPTELVAAPIISGDRVLVPAGFLLTVFNDRLAIDNLGLKDPQAMAVLRRSAAVQPPNLDTEMQMTMAMAMTLPAAGTPPQSMQTQSNIFVQQRGRDSLVTTTTSAPMLPQETMSTQMATRGGRHFMRLNAGRWSEIKAPNGAADSPAADPGLVSLLGALNLNDLDSVIKEAHAGPIYFVGGQGYQDVTATLDVNVFKKLFEESMQGTDPADIPQLALTWENATLRITCDANTGRQVKGSADFGLTINMTQGQESASLSLAMHMTFRSQPNDQPINWPVGIPK